jgi:hypothetical protein
MDKVLKIIQLHDYHFFTNFTPLLNALAVQIWRIRQKFFKGHIIVKNSKFIKTCINLKYRVKNNVLEVEPCIFLRRTANAMNMLTGVTAGGKNVCRVPRKKRTTNYLFAARQNKNTHHTIFLLGVFFVVRPKKCTRQRTEPTTKLHFPIAS